MKRSLPPLEHRSTRVLLLAWSYLDAAEGKPGPGGSHGRATSCIPSRNGELWGRGSYKQLEQAVDTLRTRNRVLAGVFDKLHVEARHWLDHPETASVNAVAALMPATINVPTAVMLSAGYNAGIRAFAPRWDSDEELGKEDAA